MYSLVIYFFKMVKKILLLVIGFLLVIGYWYNFYNTGKQKQIVADSIIKVQTEQAVSLLQGLQDKVVSGEMGRVEAEVLGADLLRSLRYGKDGYFFADTLNGVNVVLYGSAVEGTNRLDDTVNGVSYVKNIIASSKAGGGYTDYYYTRQGGTVAEAKRAYSLEFKPWGWSVGTGYYLKDVQ